MEHREISTEQPPWLPHFKCYAKWLRALFLDSASAAVEECSQKGCLALSLLELLGFNLTFVFLASLLVLIEVRWFGNGLS